jgi:hypothetical protein
MPAANYFRLVFFRQNGTIIFSLFGVTRSKNRGETVLQEGLPVGQAALSRVRGAGTFDQRQHQNLPLDQSEKRVRGFMDRRQTRSSFQASSLPCCTSIAPLF